MFENIPIEVWIGIGIGISAILGYALAKIFDKNGDDKVTVDEFVEKAKELAGTLDRDKDGFISGNDLLGLIAGLYKKR